MKKVAIAVMLLAASAFAAPVLQAPAEVAVAPDGSATIVLSVLNDLPDGIYGYSLAAGVAPAKVTLTGRTQIAPFSGLDPTTSDAVALNKDISTILDLGATGVPGVTAIMASGPFLSLTVLAPSALQAPITINWSGVMVNGSVDNEFPIAGTTVLTPEPASMLLLAAGGFLFARRRRA